MSHNKAWDLDKMIAQLYCRSRNLPAGEAGPNDIVARLRRASLTEFGLDIDKELMDEAADEIERLRKEGGN